MYLQQTRIHQFMINVFYRDDFENSGEKNKRGSVDLDIFTGRGFDFCATATRSHALATTGTPISEIEIGRDFASQNHKQPIFAICDYSQLLFKVLFLEESSKVLFLRSPIHSYQCVPWNQRRMKSRSPVWRKKLK